ncbi:uncharacterized protein PRCAT00002554001 [Priceomyces carsonii]|uniref:uncharacterized protein n=1 Tax=Priceomyces carsonii TaxID=28549 RepID=UPI002ED9198B|nr:unnamed protein product [Priceomyces carsonii]
MLRGTTMLTRALRGSLCGPVRPLNSRVVASTLRTSRLYSTKDEGKKSEKPQKPQSILDDDLLAKSGFEGVHEKPKEEKDGEWQKSSHEGSRSSRRRRSQTSKDKQREKYANLFYLATLIGGIAGVGYLSRDWDSEEEQKSVSGDDIPNGYAVSSIYGRLSKRMSSLFTFFSEPAFENLLPPPAPEPYRRPLTLVLTLDDLLIHSSWDTKNGWRTAKRPGLDYFLGYLSTYYEIVIFSSNYQMYSENTITKLDPLHAYVSYALFREACRYKDGKLIKDLSLLNRDLSKTVLVDINEDAFALQPENAIELKPWDGSPDDTLIRLIPFLEYLATQNIKDVRPIITSFKDKSHIIEEYTEREAKLRQKWREENKHLLNSSNRPNAGNLLASVLGVPQNTINKEPKFPLDIIREHGHLQYEHFQRYLKENAGKIMEEEQKLKDEFGKVTLNKLMTEGGPSPEEIARIQAERAQNGGN